MLRIWNNYKGKTTLGKQLKAFREDRQLSQEQLAKYGFKKPAAWLSRVELGKYIPKLSEFARFEEIYGVKVIENENGEIILVETE